MVFKVLALVVFIGLVESYGVPPPWFKHSHGDCGQNFPHYHPPSYPAWNYQPWHASGPHLITTYSPVVVYPEHVDVDVRHEEPTTTEAVTEPPQGSIRTDVSGSGVVSLGPQEDDSASLSNEVSTTEAPAQETTAAYKVKPIQIKPNFYLKHFIPVHEGNYVAKTLGSVHIAPLAGHANSVRVLNAEPAPGTV